MCWPGTAPPATGWWWPLARHRNWRAPSVGFVGHGDVPVIGSAVGPRWGAMVATRHCHNEEKMRMLRERGHGDIETAYSDSTADLPLLLAARRPVVVNPKHGRVAFFRQTLPPGTPILNWGCRDRGGDPVAAPAA